MMDFCNGAMAGFLASFVTQPADVIKTSMQMYPAKHQSIMQVMLFIYQVREQPLNRYYINITFLSKIWAINIKFT